jgi:hypothetical protein
MLARYCDAKCQAAAWIDHQAFCQAPPTSEEIDARHVMGKRIASASGHKEMGFSPSLEVTLASGRKLTIFSGLRPPFDLSELPDDFTFMMPTHDMLPDLFDETIHLKVYLRHWLTEVAGESERPPNPRYVASLTKSVKKWSRNLERLYSRVDVHVSDNSALEREEGSPEAVKIFNNFMADIKLLVVYRYVHEGVKVFGLLDIPEKTPLDYKDAMLDSVIADNEGALVQKLFFTMRLPAFTERIGRLAVRRSRSLQCHNCNEMDGLHLQWCTGCRAVKYCSKACQRESWRARHKSECKTMSAAATTTETAALGSATWLEQFPVQLENFNAALESLNIKF